MCKIPRKIYCGKQSLNKIKYFQKRNRFGFPSCEIILVKQVYFRTLFK